jgi:hypothetical protein
LISSTGRATCQEPLRAADQLLDKAKEVTAAETQLRVLKISNESLVSIAWSAEKAEKKN